MILRKSCINFEMRRRSGIKAGMADDAIRKSTASKREQRARGKICTTNFSKMLEAVQLGPTFDFRPFLLP